MRHPIEQTNADDLFQLCDCLRYDRLRDCEVLGRFGHAAPLGDRDERIQLAQFQTTADLLRRSNHWYSQKLSRQRKIELNVYRKTGQARTCLKPKERFI
jgi:hypothetical protein